MAAPFQVPRQAGNTWFSAGLAASFPDISQEEANDLSGLRWCRGDLRPGCKVFQIPQGQVPEAQEVDLDDGVRNSDLKDQVLVFQYSGKFYAVDHQCPHSAYPLSNGTPFDVEDFGIVLSAGISCPKHGWSFDLHTGQADRGLYKLGVWEVQLRPSRTVTVVAGDDISNGLDQEVWVRRKPRLG